MSCGGSVAALPPLPDPAPLDHLADLDDAALEAVADAWAGAERALLEAMAPYERRLREVRGRLAQVATEKRRRERAARHAARVAVRQAAAAGGLPTLAEVLEREPLPLPDATPLAQLRCHLTTGGEVGLGYPTKPGVVSFTDGRGVAQATTLGEAKELWLRGWEFGAPGVPGVRVHLSGTRVERVVPADEVVVSLPAVTGG